MRPVAGEVTSRGLVALAAGGTGGHLFPAQALAEELGRRGYAIELLSDERVAEFGSGFPARAVHQLPSATITPGAPLKVPGQLLKLYSGYRRARALFAGERPVAVAGFGGYPSFAPLIAASRMGIASLVHEQNAVMGRANRVLARRVTAIASSFPEIANLDEETAAKVVMTGNPVRQMVLDAAGQPYRAPAASDQFNLLVFGGSQGARFFSELMPEVVRELPTAVRARLRLTQQCRAEDIEAVRAAYQSQGIKAELASFFKDMPARIAQSHLVICRSGASSIAELGVIGRPAVLVPLPHALDNDQLRNAESFVAGGGGWLMRQGAFAAGDLAAFLTRLRYQDKELATAAESARLQGRPDAAARLADLVERIAGNMTPAAPQQDGENA